MIYLGPAFLFGVVYADMDGGSWTTCCTILHQKHFPFHVSFFAFSSFVLHFTFLQKLNNRRAVLKNNNSNDLIRLGFLNGSRLNVGETIFDEMCRWVYFVFI